MKDLCLFYDSSHPDSGFLGLFDGADIDFKKNRSSFPNATYKICAIYLTEIQSLDVIARLFGATFHATSGYSMIDGALHISEPKNQVISWLQDLAKLTGTENSLYVFSGDDASPKEDHLESGSHHTSAQKLSFVDEDNQFGPDDSSTAPLKKEFNGINLGVIEDRNKTSKQKSYEHKFETEVAIEISLDNAPDLSGTKPTYFIYKGQKYPVKSWKEFLQKIFELLDNTHPRQLRVLASRRNTNPTFGPYPSLVLDKTSEKYEQLPISGVCFATNSSANNTIKLIKHVFMNLDIDSSNLIIAYNNGKGRTSPITASAPTSVHIETEEKAMGNSISYPNSTSALVKYLKQNGYTPHGANLTQVKVSNGAYQFAPRLRFFKNDWTLILDDTITQKYYIFEIPGNSIETKGLKCWKSNNIYYTGIRISYGDPTFTDGRSKTIRFDNYLEFEMDYSDKLFFNADKETSKKAGTAKRKVITLTPLSQIPDGFNSHKIAYFEFQGARYEAEHWKDALDVVVDYLYQKNPEVIYSLAHKNVGFDLTSNDSRNPFFSLNESAFKNEDLAHHIKGTEIYFKTNYSVAIIVNRCIKGLLTLFNEDLSQLVFAYY